jgi:hypothetical protein
LILKKSLQPRESEEMIARGEKEGKARQQGTSEPDAAQDPVMVEEGIEDAAGALVAMSSDGEGIETDHDINVMDADLLKVIENVPE